MIDGLYRSPDYVSNVIDVNLTVGNGGSSYKNYEIAPVDAAKAGAFVGSLYSGLLGRNASVAEINAWKDALVSRDVCLAQVVKGIIDSAEFGQRQLDNRGFIIAVYEGVFGRTPSEGEIQGWLSELNSEYVTVLYNTFLARDPDAKGLSEWVAALEGGAARDSIIGGFALSPEFIILLASYGLSF